MNRSSRQTAYFHLSGLFEFYDFYEVFLPLFREHGEFFYDWCDIGSIYGAPGDCLWGGGRMGYGDAKGADVKRLVEEYDISARLTFSNSLLRPEHLTDSACNRLCRLFESPKNGITITSDLLLDYIREKYPAYYFVSSTTKVLTAFSDFRKELARPEFSYVVPDFRLNRRFEDLKNLTQEEKIKTEFLVNECCSFTCPDRKACYEAVSRLALGEEDGSLENEAVPGQLAVGEGQMSKVREAGGKSHGNVSNSGREPFRCTSPDAAEGYRFSRAMKNPAFISCEDIRNIYLPMGFSQFKIEGRSLGSALLLEFILYYMTRPEYQLNVREEIYLTNELDLF